MTNDIVAWHFLATLPQPHGRSLRACYALGEGRHEAADRIFAVHPQAVIQQETGRPLTLEQLAKAVGADDLPSDGSEVYCIQRVET